MKKKNRLISLLLSIIMFTQVISTNVFAEGDTRVLPENTFPSFSSSDMQNQVKESEPTPKEIIDALFEGVNDYEGYINLLKEKRNDIEPRFDEYKLALLNKVSVSEEMFEDILCGGIDKTDAVIMAVYVNNTEITLEQAKQMQKNFDTKFSRYEALDTYFLIKEATDEKSAEELKDMLISGYEAHSLKSATYLSTAFGVMPSQTGVYRTFAECIEENVEDDEWTKEGLRLCADPTVLKTLSGGIIDAVKSIAFDTATFAAEDPAKPNLNYGEVSAPYMVQNTLTEGVDMAHQDLTLDYSIVNLSTYGGLPFGLNLHYDSSEATYKDYSYRISYRQDFPVITTPLGRPSFFKQTVNVGAGWSWGLPYIEFITVNNPFTYKGEPYLAIHMPNGAVYNTDIEWNLQNADMYNVSFYKQDIEFVDGVTVDTELVDQKAMISYYFDIFGRLVGIKDIHGNYVIYRYQSELKMSYLKEIEDETGRKITIDYEDIDSRTQQITVTAPDGKQTKMVSQKDEETNEYVLSYIVNPENKMTKFTYENFHLESAIKYLSISEYATAHPIYAALTSVEYPTAAKTYYSYYTADEKTRIYFQYEMDTRYREDWTSLKLGSRRDCIGDKEYNAATYTYEKTTNTGVYEYENGYKYDVTVDQGGGKRIYHFDESRKCVKEEYFDEIGGNTVTKDTQYLFERQYWDKNENAVKTETYPLPEKITTTKSTKGFGDTQTTVEEYAYSLSPFGEVKQYLINGRKTTYEYNAKRVDPYNPMLDIAVRKPTLVRFFTDYNTLESYKNLYTYDTYTADLLTAATGVIGDVGGKRRIEEYTYDEHGRITDLTVREPVYRAFNWYNEVVGRTAYVYKDGEEDTPYVTSVIPYSSWNTTAPAGSFSYDLSNGYVMGYTDTKGNQTAYDYDIMGRVLSETYADGTVTSVSYGFPAKTIATDDGFVTVFDQTVTYTDATGRKSRITYDALGREISRSMYDDGAWIVVSTAEYNEYGQLANVGDAYGNKTSYEYDGFGRLIKTVNPDDTYSTCTYYDGLGAVKYTSETGVTTATYSNELGETISQGVVELQDGEETYIPLENYEYDRIGRLIKSHSAQGSVTTYEYDTQSNMLESITYDASYSTAPNNRRQCTYKYDVFGRVTYTDIRSGPRITNTYDMLGRLIESDTSGKKELYEYDDNGNLTKKTDKNGTVFTNTYDVKNRLVQTSASSSTLGNSVKTWTYDDAGRTLKIDATDLSEVSYAYDDVGRISGVTRNGKTITYTYDNNSNVISVNDYFDNVTEYIYNDRGLVVNVGNTFFEYNADGSIKKQTTGIYTQTYNYDDRGLLDRVIITNNDGAELYNERNEYDIVGNRTRTDSVFGEVSGNKTVRAGFYEYNVYGELSYELLQTLDGYLCGDEWVEERLYTYNDAGDLYDDGKDRHFTNGLNQLTSSRISGKNVTYEYDEDGNMTKRSRSGERDETYTYNVWGNLIEDDNKNTVKVTYTYYADGLRESKTVTRMSTIVYYYDGDVVIDEESGTGRLEAANTIVGNRIIARNAYGYEAVFGYNTHGDVALVLNPRGGDPIHAYSYDAYGNLRDELAGFYERNYNGYDKYYKNPVRYAGQYWDDENGLYYMRARYYDPSIKRFTQEDPIRDGINWYMYCAGNPVRFRDINGNAWEFVENMKARANLTNIVYSQYEWLQTATLSVELTVAINIRIIAALNSVESNKDLINSVSAEYGVPSDIIGGIIFKEQLTKSLPDTVANIDTWLDGNLIPGSTPTHSTGLGAIFPATARKAWESYDSSMVDGLTDKELQYLLSYDDEFNVRTIAVVLLYEAGSNNSPESSYDRRSDKWYNAVKKYNGSDAYARKVYQYRDDIKELLD